MFEMFPVKVLLQALKPYALSPVPNNHPGSRKSLLTAITGLVRPSGLELLTTSVTGVMNAAIVSRTWGLTKQETNLQEEFYGPNFTYHEFMKTSNVFMGVLTHYGLLAGATLLLSSPVRKLMRKFIFKPGEGPDKVEAKKDRIEFQAVAKPDGELQKTKLAFGRLSYVGSMYYCKSSLEYDIYIPHAYNHSDGHPACSRGCHYLTRRYQQVDRRCLHSSLSWTAIYRTPSGCWGTF